jgi:UDP-N-acetylglucosamine acyltransferase
MSKIHPHALVDAKAELDSSVEVGPFAVIGPGVKIGAGSRIGAHCVLEGPTTIGRDNQFFPHSSIGAAPQDKKYAGEPTELVVGDRNVVREFCTFNRGTAQDAGVTRLGDDNWIMAYVHLAHDCQVGHKTIFANNAQLAGHVHVGDWAILGGFTVVHQFVHIGAHSMTGMGSILFQDLPPFVMAAGNTAEARSINLEGLKRRGFTPEQIHAVKQMYRTLYRRGLPLEQARLEIMAQRAQVPEADAAFGLMLDFMQASTRGIIR